MNLTSEETWDPDNIPNVSKFTSDIDAQEMVNGCDSDFDLKFLKFNASSLHKKNQFLPLLQSRYRIRGEFRWMMPEER